MIFRLATTLVFTMICIPLVTESAWGESFPNVSADDWPWWRGPQRNGIANEQSAPPTMWSDTRNVVWKVKVPGRGHGSPTVVGDAVYLAVADRERDLQAVICYDRNTGEPRWETVVHRGGLMKKNEKASQASSSIACDGESLYITFLNDGAVYTTALTLDGRQLWQRKISDYIIHQGYASSPALYDELVIVSADNKGGGAIAALHRKDGSVVWRRERPAKPNYPSPVIVHAGGRDQLIFTGCDLVTSLSPLTGETYWEVPGSTTECVTSTVTDGERVFTSGGYPRNHLSAVRADGSGKLEWENNDRIYVPSMLIRDGVLYAVLDAGVAACWRTDTGEELWKARLGGTFSASPVMVGDLIYVANEAGETFIYKANPKRFELVAKNKLGDEVFATQSICGGRIYTRVAFLEDGRRQEYLYCLARP
jgi:outer membrane protein assembly factor BamB